MKLFTLKWLLPLLALSAVSCRSSLAQRAAGESKLTEIPAVFSGIQQNAQGKMYVEFEGEKMWENVQHAPYTLLHVVGNPRGSATGIDFDMQLPEFNGILYYGFIPYGDSKHPHPVYFKREARIEAGKASVNLAELGGRYDMIGWQQNGKGTLGYRLSDDRGNLLYDGIVSFIAKGPKGPFEVDLTLISGPCVNQLSPAGAIISFGLNRAATAKLRIGDQVFESNTMALRHEIQATGLAPDTEYAYTVEYGENRQKGSFRTAPAPGSRSAFSFAYASDSRSALGGGERSMHGPNFYIMKKIMALAAYKSVRFFQFTGDLVDGYVADPADIRLQYANWQRVVDPFARYFPVVAGMGNHESVMREFVSTKNNTYFGVNRFPFDTESGETAFATAVCNPLNGPESEDGAAYDPNPDRVDFPAYKETVFHYSYDNVGMIVLNSNYLYTPDHTKVPLFGGNIHAYIMDQQLAWLEKTLAMFEQDPNIDHVFVTVHTPFFPNGGHVYDDMWYNGKNEPRPYIAGKALEKGIIERRDQMLELIVNKSAKTLALLTGDEHNFALTTLEASVNIYPPNWSLSKVSLGRRFYQINNGAAGAPYYAQERTPWSNAVSGFTTQNALVLLHIEGKSVKMEVRNPDTLEEIMTQTLR